MIIPSGYAQSNWKFTGTSLPTGAEITLGLDIELATFEDPAAMASALFDTWDSSGMRAFHSNSVFLSSVMVKWGPNATGPQGDDAGSFAGTGSGEPDSPNTAALVKKNTGFGGRTGSGRLYIPGLAAGQVFETGLLSSAFLAAGQAALNDWHADLIAIGCVPALLHGPDSPVSAPMPITSFTLDPKVATQRRRLRR